MTITDNKENGVVPINEPGSIKSLTTPPKNTGRYQSSILISSKLNRNITNMRKSDILKLKNRSFEKIL
tara:strand:+ start:380 stop:583 length:204 start_codon:yes stop_codon:yes gene_type:complete